MMAKLLCFTFASPIVCRNLLFPILPFTLLSLPGRTETTDRAAVLRTELIRPNRRTARTAEPPDLYRPRPLCYFLFFAL